MQNKGYEYLRIIRQIRLITMNDILNFIAKFHPFNHQFKIITKN